MVSWLSLAGLGTGGDTARGAAPATDRLLGAGDAAGGAAAAGVLAGGGAGAAAPGDGPPADPAAEGARAECAAAPPAGPR